MITQKAKNCKTDRRKKRYTFPCYNIRDCYRHFRNMLKEDTTYPNLKKLLAVKRYDYYKITAMCNEELSNVILEGASIQIPYKLGTFEIIKSKIKPEELERRLLDYDAYRKTREVNFKEPEYLPEYKAKWGWSKRDCKVKNKRMYSFTTCRANIVKLRNLMKEPYGHNRYLERLKVITK